MRKGGEEGDVLAGDHPMLLERVTTTDVDERMPPALEREQHGGDGGHPEHDVQHHRPDDDRRDDEEGRRHAEHQSHRRLTPCGD